MLCLIQVFSRLIGIIFVVQIVFSKQNILVKTTLMVFGALQTSSDQMNIKVNQLI